jgi:hypothetical protein
MKKIVLAVLLAATSLVLVGCSAVNQLSGGNGGSPTSASTNLGGVVCVNGEADLTTAGSKNTLRGACAKVVISGNNITLTAADITHLTVSGNNNAVDSAVLGDATVVGQSNIVRTSAVGPVTVSGNGNTLLASGPVGDVVVTGANDTVTTPSTMGKVTQSGIGNKIGAP